MPRQVLFIQGGGEGTHDHWDNKLVASLERDLGPDYEIGYPLMPGEDDPQYERWKTALEQELAKLDAGAILVGHSFGGTILISALAEMTLARSPGGLFMISAPFVGKGGWSIEDIPSLSNVGAKLPTDMAVYLYHGSEDTTVSIAHVDLYKKEIPDAIVRRLAGRDHQLNDDLSDVAADIRRCAKS